MIAAMLAAAALSQAPASTFTAEPDADERAQFDACLAEAGYAEALNCRGVVARPCLDAPGGETTAGMIACTSRELALWDELLNTAYADMMSTLERTGADSRRAALREAQRAWIGYRDGECRQQALQFEGGSLARVIHVSCVNDLTARRASNLRDQGEDADL